MAGRQNIDILIKSVFDAKGASQAKAAIDALRKAQGAGSGGNAAAQAAKAQADALRLQAQAAKTAAAESNAATAAARAQAAQANAAAAAIRQQATAQQQAASAATQADRAILSNANSAAALARAEGDAARAADIYRAAIVQLTPGSNQAIQAQTRLAQAMNALNKSSREAAGGAAVLPRTIAGFSGEAQKAVDGLKSVAAGIGGVVAAGAALKGAYDLAKLGAGAAAAKQSFDSLAASAGTSGKALLANLQAAANGTVAQTDIIKSANTALLLLGSDVATKLPQLLQVAKASATTLGQDVGFVFDSLVTGISRGSTELIDNAGITISASEAYETYAASIGKSAAELTKAERSQAVLNGVLSAGQTIIAQSGASGDNAAAQFQRFEASVKDLATALGGLLASSGVPGFLADIMQGASEGAEQLSTIGSRVEDVSAQIIDSTSSFGDYSAKITEVNNQLAQIGTSIQPLTEAQYAYAQSLIASGTSAQQALAQVQALSPVFQDIAVAQIDAANASVATGAAFAALGPQMASIAASGAYGQVAIQNLTYAFQDGALTVPQLAAALDYLQVSITNAATASEQHAAIESYRTGEIMAGAAATDAATQSTEMSGDAILKELQSKQENAAQTEVLAAAQAELSRLGDAVAGGLMSAGQAALIMAQQYNIAFGAAMALVQAQAQLGQAKVNAVALSDQRAGERAGGGSLTFAQTTKQYDAERRQAQKAAQAQKELADAQRAQTIATGTQAQKLALLNKELKNLKPGTAAYVEKQTEIMQAQRAKGGGGGGRGKKGGGAGGGQSKEERAATQAGEKLQSIAKQTGDKLADIDESAQKRLIAIDERAAEQRAKALQSLNEEILRSSAETNADLEANDLDLYRDIDDKQRAALERREQAEVTYRQRVSQAQEEARQIAASGDAQYAREYLAAKTKEAQDLMRLEQQAAEARAETNDPAGLEQAVQEAVAARQQQTQTEIDLAQAASDQRTASVAEEKANVIAEADAQKAKIIANATEQASAVKGASADATAAVIAGFRQQAEAIKQATSAAKEYASAVSGAGSAAPSGGSTGGGSAPSSGGGASTGGSTTNSVRNGGKLANAGGFKLANTPMGGNPMLNADDLETTLQQLEEVNRLIDEYARRNKVDPGTAKKYADTVNIVRDAMTATVELRRLMLDTGQPLDMGVIGGLIQEATDIGKLFVSMNLGGKVNLGLLEAYGEGIKAAIDVIHSVLDMRRDLKDIPPAADLNVVMMLIDESSKVVRVVQDNLIKLYQEERDGLKAAGEALESTVGVLNSVIDLRNGLKDLGPPVVQATIQNLIDEAMATLQLARGLQGLTVDESDTLEAVAQQVENTISIITNMADLRNDVRGVAGPVNPDTIRSLLNEAAQIRTLAIQLMKDGASGAQGLETYADTIDRAVSVLSNIIDLRGKLSGLHAPIDQRVIEQLSAELRKVVIRFYTDAIPMCQELVTASEQYSTAAGQATESLQGMADLRDAVSAPLAPISDQAIERLSAELRKVVIRFYTDAIPFAQETVDAAQSYADVAQGAIDTFSAAAELGANLKASSAIPLDIVQRVAADIQQVARIFLATVVPMSEDTADQSSRYASAASDAIGTISDAATLGNDLSESSPIPMDTVRRLAREIQQVTGIFRDSIIPTSEELADASGRYASVAGDAIGTISDAAGLGESLKDLSPINLADVRRAAKDAKDVTAIFLDDLLPVTEEQADAAGRYSDAADSATSAISSTLGLTAQMFADYQSPSDAQLERIVADADRIIAAVSAAAARYSTDGLTAAQNYGDALGTTVDALLGTGQLVEALKYGNEYIIDPGVLAQFEGSAQTILEMGGRLGAVAATQDYSALTGASTALSGLYDTLIKAAAVPWGDLPAVAGAMGSSATATMLTIAPGAITIYQQPGQDAAALANLVIQQLEKRTTARRH